jgi:hypothetical protein
MDFCQTILSCLGIDSVVHSSPGYNDLNLELIGKTLMNPLPGLPLSCGFIFEGDLSPIYEYFFNKSYKINQTFEYEVFYHFGLLIMPTTR